MPWLLCDGKVLCSVEMATTRAERRRGLLGRDGIDGALLISPARSVHTLGMRFAIDVAHLDEDGTVLHTCTMKRHRLGRVVTSATSVIETEAGAFDRWGLRAGDVVTIRVGDSP